MNEPRSPALKNRKEDSDNESIDARPVDLVCLVYSVCLVQPANKINQIDQIDETDQMNKPCWQTFSATC